MKLWVSTERWTGQVNVNSAGKITFTPPVWRKFKGQHFSRLRYWLFEVMHENVRVEVL